VTARGRRARDLTQVCDATRGIGGPPIERMAQVLNPDEAQRAALDDLGTALRKAADQINADCPREQFLTPTGRVDAMAARLRAALAALDIVQPALERFYNSLSDEQKARFNQRARVG
jgi:hypothetical protein